VAERKGFLRHIKSSANQPKKKKTGGEAAGAKGGGGLGEVHILPSGDWGVITKGI